MHIPPLHDREPPFIDIEDRPANLFAREGERLLPGGFSPWSAPHFPLTGLPDAHSCPECGRPYDIESTRTQWLRWLPPINR